jgi:tetratricopeptide (TPR) repeat protein
MRMLKIHQNALDEKSITLYENFRKLSDRLLSERQLESIQNIRHQFVVELEVISIYLMYRRTHKAEELLKQLKTKYNIETVEEGILGMRTKWQQKALPQLHVAIKQENSELNISSEATHGNSKLLRLLDLDDDTRLESIQFVDDKRNELQELSSTLQNFILITIQYMQMSQPKDKLSDEEIKPYLTLLLRQMSGPWSVRLNALLINIKCESDHRRTVERSLRQCEDIVNYIKSKDETSAKERLSLFFSSLLAPLYKIEAQLADLMMSLGLVKGALDIYLNTHQWENVINCYTRLQLRHKAAEVIKLQLERRPTAKLYCLLGDATDDVSCYEEAWKFSQHKSGLAQRHWGMYFFGKGDYESAIPHLQKSLEINSLQENLWLRLGYACLSIEKYEQASSAYIHYTQLEPSGFESWNNLAKCFIKMGNKKRAHKVLQESLKCNYDNWKIWENFLLVSIDIGSFEDALNAYNRLIELKEKYFDEEVLKILVKAISENLVDAEGKSSIRLRKKTIEMLAHLGAIHSTEGVIYELSALLTTEPLKKAEKLQKAYRGYTSVSII